MGQAEIVINLIHGELLAEAGFVFAQGYHPPPDCGDMLANRQVDPLNERCIDLPAVGRQDLLDNS
jgi:hypothetical protein